MIESSVVFPQPLAPSNNTNSPPFTSSERPSIGRTAYPPDEYSITRSLTTRSVMSRTPEREGGIDLDCAPQPEERCEHPDEKRRDHEQHDRTAWNLHRHRHDRLQRKRENDRHNGRQQCEHDGLESQSRRERSAVHTRGLEH